jgi:hypothetical protein
MKTSTHGELSNPVLTRPDVSVVQLQVVQAPSDPGDIFASIQARADAVTLVLEEILQTRPPPHWGINE